MSDSVQITIGLPSDLAQHAVPARETVEAVAMPDAARASLIAYQAQRLLGFQMRWEFEGSLRIHGVGRF